MKKIFGALAFALVLFGDGCASHSLSLRGPSAAEGLKPDIYLSPQGSDSDGDGSRQSPFRTVAKAAVFAGPGSTIWLAGGVYLKSSERLELHGEKGKPVRISALPGEKPTLDAEGVGKRAEIEAEDKSEIFTVLELKNSEHVEIDGLEVRNSVGSGIGLKNSHHITVRNCSIHHLWSAALGGSGDDLTFENNQISYSSLMNENDLVLKQRAQGLKTYWAGGGGTWRHEDGSLCKRIVWRGNHIHHIWGEGLSVLHVDGGLYEDNVVHDAYSVLIYIDHSRNVVVRRNVLYNTALEFTRIDVKYPPAAIGVASEYYKTAVPTMTENIEISSNVISNAGLGIFFWRDPDNKDPTNRYRNVRVRDNIIHSTFLIPFSFKAIDAKEGEEPTNELVGNEFSNAPYFSLDDNGRARMIKIENPSLWRVEDNVFAKPADRDMEKLKLASNKRNRFIESKMTPWLGLKEAKALLRSKRRN